ncbi:MAG: hypothetical protein K8S56_08195, partial [Candidatus Cloacimonetes bacterium]|nr:hypothetical protein [Candidatus Cloacimonadota bacterium]
MFALPTSVEKDFQRQDSAVIRVAEKAFAKGQFHKVNAILSNLHSQSHQAQLLQIKTLYKLNRFQEVISNIEKSDSEFRERYFGEYIYDYLQSLLKTESNLPKLFQTNKSTVSRAELSRLRFVVAELFSNGNFSQIPSIMKILPTQLFHPLEKRLFLSVNTYYMGNLVAAGDSLSQLIPDLQATTDKDTLMTRRCGEWIEISLDYLSLIVYQENFTPEIDSWIPVMSQQAKINFIYCYLKKDKIDEAELLRMTLSQDNPARLATMLIALRQHHYRTAEGHLAKIDTTFIADSTAGILARAEIDYQLAHYQKAVDSFKAYKKQDDAYQPYANFAIGHSFYGFYKFNNTAWYWLKNLSPNEKTMWDSLASVELARLYMHTGHPETAATYFRKIRRKYPQVLSGSLLGSYLNYLRLSGDFSFLEEELKLLGAGDVDIVSIYSELADYHYTERSFAKALHYYKKILPRQLSDRQVLRSEKCLAQQSGDFNEEAFLNDFVSRYPHNEFASEIRIELMDYYSKLEKYEKVLVIA